MARWMLACVIAAAGCGGVKGNEPDGGGGGDDDAAVTECPASCALGCAAGTSVCSELAPSNGLAMLLDQAAQGPDLVLTGTATIDTDSHAITDATGNHTVPNTTLTQGLPIGVFVIQVKSLVAERIDVTGSRALAIVSHGNITLKGVLSVSARRDVGGPGAIANEAGCRGGTGAMGPSAISGGGGGGFGTPGGGGGNASVHIGGAAGGTAGSVELVPLRGGCPGGHPGGRGNSTDPVDSDPGAGGGAVQLVSRTAIALDEGAFIAANGAGGKSRDAVTLCISDEPCGDGEGGGSGGAILLEAPVVTVAARAGLVANGGAGQCLLMDDAAPGALSDRPAVGQRCGGDTGDGGNGAAGAVAATAGGNGSADDPVGGGGGGGAGRIRINLPSGRPFTPTGLVSPAPTVGVLGTR